MSRLRIEMRRAVIVSIIAAATALPAKADQLWCQGTIQSVLMYSDGRVMIVGSWRQDYTQVCTTQGSWGGISTETCLSWYGAAIKARADHSNVTVNYGNAQGFTCSNVPTYGSSLVPGYLMLNQ
jgi:hypothetical protein